MSRRQKAPEQRCSFYTLEGLLGFFGDDRVFFNERMRAFRAFTASSHGQGVSASSQVEGASASSQTASSQVDWQTVGFYLANKHEVVDPTFVRDEKIGLFVSVLGMHSRPMNYPPVRRRCISP